MSDHSDTFSVHENEGIVSFSGRLLTSPAFKELFDRGMSLVEEAATYLDTRGRVQSKLLDKEASLTYATESMRLTTRLMQLASWLLLQRAVSEGEMSVEQAMEEKQKVRLKRNDTLTRARHWDHLPEELQSLIERSMRLQEQVLHFDDALMNADKVTPQEQNPLHSHFNLIQEAFQK